MRDISKHDGTSIVGGEAVVCGCDDAASCFNQYALRPPDLRLSSLVWISDDRAVSIVNEARLGFGLSARSNVSQRFSEELLVIVRCRFDAEEAALFSLETDPVLIARLAQRVALSLAT
jgi:hypothetical protein